MEMSGIDLRTLAGAGQAKLLDPLPFSVGNIPQDASATITLHLDVPSTVKRLEITERGTLSTRESSPYKFSTGQAILLP